jgi:hypothetical protein
MPRAVLPMPWGFALLVGIIEGVAARRIDSGLSGWEEFWIVVGGSLLAAVVLGCAQWLWRRTRRPILEIECGVGFNFEKRVGNTDAAVAPAVEEHRPLAAYAKFVRVSETRGRSGARNVVVRMKDVSPSPPHTTSPVELRWADSKEANNIRPHGHKDAFAQLVIFYETQDGKQQGWRMTPTVLEHDDKPEFTLEILVEGKRYSETAFRMENVWSRARIDALPNKEWPPVELEYPTIERA